MGICLMITLDWNDSEKTFGCNNSFRRIQTVLCSIKNQHVQTIFIIQWEQQILELLSVTVDVVVIIKVCTLKQNIIKSLLTLTVIRN